MTAAQGNLASLSRYIFRVPSWQSSVAFALLLAALTGVAAFDSNVPLQDAYEGIFFIGVPTLVASFLTSPIDRILGGHLTYNRSSLLALASEIVVVAIMIAAGAVALVTSLGQDFVFDALLVGLAAIFALRLAVVMAISHRNPLVAAVPACIQTATAAVLLFVYSGTLQYFDIESGTYQYLDVGASAFSAYLSRPAQAPDELHAIVPQDFALLAGMCVLHSFVVWGIILAIDRPWRRSLGVSGFDFVRGFIGHVAEGSRELEEFFEQIGEQAIVPVTVLAFRRPSGEEKARFVLPMIHPGPMGEIGGGNLPERIARGADGLAFPPHATAGHDFNLVTESEVEPILDAARRARESIEFDEGATRSSRTNNGEISLLGQAFGDDALMAFTFSPAFADDVDFGVGMSAIAEARVAGLDDVMLVDAHNCNDGLEGEDLGHVTPGSKRSFDLYRAAADSGRILADEPRHPFELGTAWDPTEWTPRDGIGPLGIRVAVVRVREQETAYVLVDGNNMEPGVRDRIVERLDVEAEVMTTDTHLVNTVKSVNQVGETIDETELIEHVETLVDAAREDLEPVEGGMAVEHAEVIVFGNDRTETLASHANAVIPLAGALVGVVVVATVTISFLVFLLTAS